MSNKAAIGIAAASVSTLLCGCGDKDNEPCSSVEIRSTCPVGTPSGLEDDSCYAGPEPLASVERLSHQNQRLSGIQEVVVHKNYAYLSDGGASSIYVVDTNSGEKVNTLIRPQGTWTSGLALDDERDLLYVCGTTAHLAVLDISDPRNTSKVRTLSETHIPCYMPVYDKSRRQVYINQWAYVGHNPLHGGPGGVIAIDVSNPTRPRRVGDWTLNDNVHAQQRFGGCPLLQGMQYNRSDDYIYTVRYGPAAPGNGNEMCPVTDRSDPQSGGNLYILRPTSTGIQYVSSMEFGSTCGPFHVAIDSGKFAFAGCYDSQEIATVDISNPSSPQEVSRLSMPDREVGRLYYSSSRNKLYAATRQGSILMMNVDGSGTLTLQQEVLLPEFCAANSLFMKDGYLYAASVEATLEGGSTALTKIDADF